MKTKNAVMFLVAATASASLAESDASASSDLMAYKDVAVQFVAIGTDNVESNWTWYAVMDAENEAKEIRGDDGLIYKQTPASAIRSAATTYKYGQLTGVGRHVTFGQLDGSVKAAEYGSVRLVHAQVFADCGFDTATASRTAYDGGMGVNTKPFTRDDKYLVPAYLNAIGVQGVSLDPYVRDANGNIILTNGVAQIRKDAGWLLFWNDKYGTDVADADADDVADGWELYTMFGVESEIAGVSRLGDFLVNPFAQYDAGKAHTLANAKISPFNSADGMLPSPGDKALAKAGEKSKLGESVALTLAEEFDHGYWPTDPWRTDTDNDNVIDHYAYRYHLKADDAGEDFDGDGLSNSDEYLITEVFQFAVVDPDNSKTNGSCVDYFRKVGELYFGEIFTDHDQVDDQWEQTYETSANRYIYDPSADPDGDGWSNWAESKAGTDPGRVASPGAGGEIKSEYPIPTIAANVMYGGMQKLEGDIVFQCWNEKSDPGMVGTPDAEWRSGAVATTNVTRYIGRNPGTTTTYQLGTGIVKPGTVKIYFLDMAFEKAALVDGAERYSYRGEVGDARWYYFVQDYNGDLYTAVTNGTQTKVGTVNYATGEITVDYGNAALQQVVYDRWVNGDSETDHDTKTSGIYSNYDKIDLSRSYVRMQWEPVKIVNGGKETYYLGAASGGKGHVREGLNKFVVFCDMDGDGKYTPGEPFGFVRDVDVGWQGGAFTVQLTETSPIFARMDLRSTDGSKASDWQVWQEGDSGVMDISSNDGAYWANLRNTMGVTTYVGGGANLPDLSGTRLTRIRVTRVLVNGRNKLGVDKNGHDVSVKRVVLDKYLDLGTRSYLHEGDFLTGSAYDCDWNYIQADVVTNKVYESIEKIGTPIYIDPTKVTYAIFLGEGELGNSNLVFRCAVNKVFDYAGSRNADASGNPASKDVIRPVIDSACPQNIVYGARPTFRFAMRDGSATDYTSYTAFNIKISGNGVTYETGLRDLPPRDANGWYNWTLDEPIGTKLPASGNYTWSVALYNAKFQGPKYLTTAVTEWSNSGTFIVNMNNSRDMNDHGYSSIGSAVKYAGPGKVITNGTCIVQAFKTADFAGKPSGQAKATDKASISNTKRIDENVEIKGLPQTGTYYLRAFIDMNDNGKKDDFESWGSGTEAVTIGKGSRTKPTVGIWIEDADTDGDWIPDAYEYDKASDKLATEGEIVGGDQIVFSGTVYSAGTAGISTGLSGASLTIFQNKSFILALMPEVKKSGAMVSIDAIRKAVEKKVNPSTVKITAVTLAPDGKTVSLSVAAEVTDSIAGELLGRLYNIETGDTATVTVKVYKKNTLAEAGWKLVCETTKEVGRSAAVVDVPVSGVDMTSGFYKVEVLQ